MKYRYLDWTIESSPGNPGDNAIGILTLNRPDHSNAIGPRLTMELHQMMDEIRYSPVRVIIITGAGGNFCGGGDLQVETIPKEDQDDDFSEEHGVGGEYGEMLVWFANDYFHIVAQRMCRKLEDLPQVTIAAVDGIAVGIGIEMAVSCDLRICSDKVRFAEIAVPAGFMSEWSAPRSLPALVGQTMANEMILTGRFVFADEAKQIGLVNKVVEASTLLDEAREWAGRMASYPALGLRYAKETIRLYQNQNRLGRTRRDGNGAHLRDHPHQGLRGRYLGVPGQARSRLPRRVSRRQTGPVARKIDNAGIEQERISLMDAKGHAAIVTGGASGLGLACDVTDDASTEAAVAHAREANGPARILVNCAGVGTPGRIVGKEGPSPLADFVKVVNINLIGTYNVIRLAAADMKAMDALDTGERGVVINTASVAAFEGQIGQAAYAASKGGVAAMTLPAAREFSRSGIRVLTIAPGIFGTPMLFGLCQEVQESLAASIPFPSRLGEPDEFASLVMHMLDNVMLNGEVIRLDGAIRMQPI